MKKVQPGDSLEFPAADWNQLADLANLYTANPSTGPHSVRANSQAPRQDATIMVDVLNMTGGDINQWETVWLTDLITHDTTAGVEELNQTALLLAAYADSNAVVVERRTIGIAQEPIPAGKIGRVCISGVTPALVYFFDNYQKWDQISPEHDHALPRAAQAGTSTQMILCASHTGPARILWRPNGPAYPSLVVCLIELAQPRPFVGYVCEAVERTLVPIAQQSQGTIAWDWNYSMGTLHARVPSGIPGWVPDTATNPPESFRCRQPGWYSVRWHFMVTETGYTAPNLIHDTDLVPGTSHIQLSTLQITLHHEGHGGGPGKTSIALLANTRTGQDAHGETYCEHWLSAELDDKIYWTFDYLNPATDQSANSADINVKGTTWVELLQPSPIGNTTTTTTTTTTPPPTTTTTSTTTTTTPPPSTTTTTTTTTTNPPPSTTTTTTTTTTNPPPSTTTTTTTTTTTPPPSSTTTTTTTPSCEPCGGDQWCTQVCQNYVWVTTLDWCGACIPPGSCPGVGDQCTNIGEYRNLSCCGPPVSSTTTTPPPYGEFGLPKALLAAPRPENTTVTAIRDAADHVRRWRWITTEQFHRDLWALSQALPKDLRGVAGVPRGGILAGAYLASILNLPLYSLTKGQLTRLSSSVRRKETDNAGSGPLLVIEDDIMSGYTLRNACEGLDVPCVTAAVYQWNRALVPADYCARQFPCTWLRDWGIFSSGWWFNPRIATDFDGILCRDCQPEDDDDGERYLRFLREAQPLYTFSPHEIPLIVTARREAYREETLTWLARQKLTAKRLVMGPWTSLRDRSFEKVVDLKASAWEESGLAFFIESDPSQAAAIAARVPRPVICPAAKCVFNDRLNTEP